MCWIGENIERIAEEDIPCFKIMKVYNWNNDDVVYSVYKNMAYRMGQVYELGKKLDCTVLSSEKYSYINEGFHSYHPDVKFEKTIIDTEELIAAYPRFGLGKGIYLDAFNIDWRVYCLVECVIPKESVYYLNGKGEYVSNTIKPIRITEKYF